jgi:hypothetical protein
VNLRSKAAIGCHFCNLGGFHAVHFFYAGICLTPASVLSFIATSALNMRAGVTMSIFQLELVTQCLKIFVDIRLQRLF